MSLLERIKRSDVRREPFPHILIENAFDDQLCSRLVRDFPPLASFTRGRARPEAHKCLRRSDELLADPSLSPAWREVMVEARSPATAKALFDLLGSEVLREYPAFTEEFGSPDGISGGATDSDGPTMFFMSPSLAVCTPVRAGFRSERAPHVKLPDKVIETNLFLRAAEDETPGGEIELFEVRPGFEPEFSQRNQVSRDCLRLVRSVPYRANTMLMMVNTPRSIQQIAVRGRGAHPLQWMNINLKVRQPLFALPTDENVSARRPGGGWRSFSKFLRGSVTAP